jgi:hypothetical protein
MNYMRIWLKFLLLSRIHMLNFFSDFAAFRKAGYEAASDMDVNRQQQAAADVVTLRKFTDSSVNGFCKGLRSRL